jgi:hypothetical protein
MATRQNVDFQIVILRVARLGENLVIVYFGQFYENDTVKVMHQY